MGGERESVSKIGFAEGGERYSMWQRDVSCEMRLGNIQRVVRQKKRRESGLWDWLGIESTMGAEMILISHLRAHILWISGWVGTKAAFKEKQMPFNPQMLWRFFSNYQNENCSLFLLTAASLIHSWRFWFIEADNWNNLILWSDHRGLFCALILCLQVMKCIVEALADVLSRPRPLPVSQECLVTLKTGKPHPQVNSQVIFLSVFHHIS